jgi:hypothetical protein
LTYYLNLFFHHHLRPRRNRDSIIDTGPLNWTWDFARIRIDPKLHLGHVSISWYNTTRRPKHGGMWRQKSDGNKLTACKHKHDFFDSLGEQ